jgi:hypothetical protein
MEAAVSDEATLPQRITGMKRSRVCGTASSAAGTFLCARSVQAQSLEDLLQNEQLTNLGWHGFADFGFLADALLTLALAVALAMAIAYHPKRLRATDTLEEVEAPKVYVMYAVIGAIIGIMVLRFGTVVGFVVFGIGGLIRFRTDLRSATLTGQVIFVTLIGLSCGLELPHVAVLATAFGFALIYLLNSHATYRLDVKQLPPKRVAESAAAYRGVLKHVECRILSEKKSFGKERVSFIFQSPHHVTRDNLEEFFDAQIDPELKGAIDWEID